MTVSYKKLWKLLIDRDMMKKDLIEMTGISHSSLAKMVNNGNVNVSALVKICEVMDCDLSDIIELVPDPPAGHVVQRRTKSTTGRVGRPRQIRI